MPVYDDITGEPLLDANGAQIYTKSYLTKTRSALLPIGNLGVAMPLNKYTTSGRGYFSLVLNTQFSLSNSDDLDGYDPRDAQGYRGANERNDMYNLTYLGIRYSF